MGWLKREGRQRGKAHAGPRRGGEGKMPTDLFACEDGFTTVGAVVALMVTLTLVFTAAQAYRASSLSADVQDVADAAALAAENEVAEFMVAVRVCDAAVLSMSLAGLTVSALGVVAACIPYTAELSGNLLDMGKKVLDARDAFADKAAMGLGKLQDALPLLASANAASVASANDGGVGGDSYKAVALLVPEKGEPIEVGRSAEEREAQEKARAGAEGIRAKAQQAEDLAEEMDEAKRRAFLADCGSYPARCSAERAEHLASLGGSENPLYSSVDAWSFEVALERARSYYAARAAAAIPGAGEASGPERGRAAVRKRVYRYAEEQLLEKGYVAQGDGGFDACFPLLFRNMAQMRETPLYVERDYPITQSADGRHDVMHAWSGCPQAGGAASWGSVAQLEAESERFQTCPVCDFVPETLGNVAAATSSVDSGFEYHFRIIAEAAAQYQRSSAELQPLEDEVDQASTSLIDGLLEAVKSAASKRIEARPPGSSGAIALVVNVGSASTDAGFESAFAPAGQLGTRAAVAGATLVSDAADDGHSVISSLLDGMGDGGAAVGAGRMALDAWSGLLQAYGSAQEGLAGALEDGLESIPLASLAGLGQKAAGKLREGAEALGLQPAKLDALKPVLVNSEAVAAAGDGPLAERFHQIQQRARAASTGSTDLFGGVVQAAQDAAIEQLDRVADGIKVAEIDLPFLGEPYPVVIKLPESLLSAARDTVARCAESVRSAWASVSGGRVWQ